MSTGPSSSDMTLILGSDGFLGRHFCRYFAERGWPFHAIGRAADDFSQRENVERAFRAAPEATRILHLITHQRTGPVQYDIPGSLLFENANIHLNVLECWRLHQPQAKLISTGSSCAYPESDAPLPEAAFQSGHVHKSVRGYALAKQMLAVGSEAYSHQYGLKYLHLCLATLYGPHDHTAPDRSHFMTGMIHRAIAEKAEGKSQFTVWGAPDTVRDLLYVNDQMEAILAADAAFEDCLLNCGSNAPVTIDQSARAVIDALDWPAELYYPPGSFAGAHYKSLDCSRFLEKTGWTPMVGLVEGVRRVLAGDGGQFEPAVRHGQRPVKGEGTNEMTDEELQAFGNTIIERTLQMVRQEYTVMPRFGFHQPLDYAMDTLPVAFEPPVFVEGVELPLPPIPDRMGYAADNTEYLAWGQDDKQLVLDQIAKHASISKDMSIMDFGCSSGRVLRHFHTEAQQLNWTLLGVDVQARPIQWMRENFPKSFCVYTGSTMPILPFADNSIDIIYGFSIFTHIKYHWDMWLLELKRVLKPGGLLIQTIHTENAWDFYYRHRDQNWVLQNHSAKMLQTQEMPYDYFYYGDVSVSQVFWKRDVVRSYWERYFDVLDVLAPPDHRSFQDWVVCRKPV